MQAAAQSWLVYDLTGSKAMLGLVGMVGSVPIVVFSTFGGALADRYPRRLIIIGTQTASCILALLLGILATLESLNYAALEVWHILLFAGLLGAVNGFDMPARQAFVIEMVGREDMANAIALNSAVFHGTRIIGPAIAGLIIGLVGPGPCFLVNAFSYLSTIAALVVIRLDLIESGHPNPKSLAARGFAIVISMPEVTLLMLETFLIGTFGWSYIVLLPAFARDVHGSDPSVYGLMMSASGLGSMIGSLIVAGLNGQRYRVINASIILFSAAVFGFSTSSSFPVSLFLLIFTGMGLTAFFAGVNTEIQSVVPDEVRGRVMGVYTFVFGAMTPIGSMLAGTLAELLGAPLTVQVGSVICTITGTACYLVKRGLRKGR